MRAISILLISGAAASVASAQGLTIHFVADQTQVLAGETVTWTVTAEFTGGLPGSYFAAINASFVANDDTLGVAKPMEGLDSWAMPALGAVSTGTPELAAIRNIFAAQQALFGAVDTSNPFVIGTFDVVATQDGLGYLSYEGGAAQNSNPTWSVTLWDGVTPISLMPPTTFSWEDATYISDEVGVNIPSPWAAVTLAGLVCVRRRR